MPKNILIYCPDAVEVLRYGSLLREVIFDSRILTAASRDEAKQMMGATEILVGWKFPLDLLPEARSLRWVHKLSAGVDDVATNPDVPDNVIVTRSDGSAIAPRMIEYVLAAIYSTTQKLALGHLQQSERRWIYYRIGLAAGMTVGIAGLGEIGSAIAKRLVDNGLKVVGWRRSHGHVAGLEKVFVGRSQLGDFVEVSDFVVLALPATPETKNIISADILARMRPHTILINIGRGTLVDEPALIQTLSSQRIAGAFLDVVATEPLPKASPLWDMPGVVITPHISGPLIPEAVIPRFLEHYRDYRNGTLQGINRSRGY